MCVADIAKIHSQYDTSNKNLVFNPRTISLFYIITIITIRQNKHTFSAKEDSLLAISPRFIVQLMRNLVRRSRITLTPRPRDQNSNFQKIQHGGRLPFENGFIGISQP